MKIQTWIIQIQKLKLLNNVYLAITRKINT